MSLPEPSAYWPFDEATGTTTIDASGWSQPMTLASGTWTTTAQKFGAAAISNAGSYLAATFDLLDLGTVHSYACWINSWTGADGVIVGGASGSYAFYLEGPTVYYSVGVGNYVGFTHGGLTGSHHLCVTRSGTAVRMYKDGALLAAQTLGSNTSQFLSTLGAYNTGTLPFAGVVDDLRFYNVELTAAQVAELYALVVPPVPVSRYRSHTSVNYGGRTNTTLTAPAGIVDGDTLVLICAVGASSGGVTATPPAGFTLAAGFPSLMTHEGFTVRTYVWGKVAASEAGSYTVTHAAASSTAYLGAVIDGALTAPLTPAPTLDVRLPGDPESSIQSVAPGLTTTAPTSHVLYWTQCWDTYPGTRIPPPGMTPLFTERYESTSSILYVADGVVPAAGATGDKMHRNANITGDNPWAAGLIAVRARSGVVPPVDGPIDPAVLRLGLEASAYLGPTPLLGGGFA